MTTSQHKVTEKLRSQIRGLSQASDGSRASYSSAYKLTQNDGVQAIYEKGVKDYNTNIAIEDFMLEEATKLAGDLGVYSSIYLLYHQ